MGRNAYGALGALITVIALGVAAFALPHTTRAFSLSQLFGSPAEADTAVIPDDSVPVLAAATNADPNPNKGGSSIVTTENSALISEAGPNGSIPDMASIPTTSTISTYTVQDGDTLSQIAQKFGVSTNTILWANNLTIKSTIRPGMELTILPVSGIQHTVQKGETLSSLAKKYDADANEIATYNGLLPGSALTAGSTIIIPGGELSAPASTPSSSSGSASSAKSSAPASSLPGNTTGNPYRGGSGAEIDGYYINPVPGAVLTQGLHGENAVDLGIAKGTPIHAAAAGTVIVSANNGAWNGGYGNYVVISHANGTQTLYAHMTKTAVSVGQSVAQGDVIGYVGMTGDATGPHLHFEVRGARNPFVSSIDEGLCHLDKVCSPQ